MQGEAMRMVAAGHFNSPGFGFGRENEFVVGQCRFFPRNAVADEGPFSVGIHTVGTGTLGKIYAQPQKTPHAAAGKIRDGVVLWVQHYPFGTGVCGYVVYDCVERRCVGTDQYNAF